MEETARVPDLESAAARLLDLARDGLPRPAIDLVLGLLAGGASAHELIVEVLAPVQRHVGARWAANEWTIADEHAATAVIDGALGALALQTPVPDEVRGRVLVACAEGESHATPARMGAELLRDAGWEVAFLGASLPADDLQRYAAATEPDVVVISCTVEMYLPGARRSFAAVAELGLPRIAAGAAFGKDDRRALRLGASGWLGPGVDLTTLLDDVPAAEPVPRPPPEALALERSAAGLQQTCVSAMAAGIPQLATRPPAQLARTRVEIGYLLGSLAAAIDVGDDDVYWGYVEWLAGLWAARGVPSFVLDRSLEIIGDVLATAGMTEAARLCAADRA